MDSKPENNIAAVELFAGIGGFRLAAQQFGINTVWANDIDPHAASIYRDRFGNDSFIEGDIWKLIDSVPNHNLLTGGFPCQPFSSAGKKKGVEDPRGTLFEAIIRILEKHQPEYFILENVKRLLTMDSGRHFATILASLSVLDYRIEWRLLNALDFSLPQNRQRVVITGIHKKTLLKNGLSPHDIAAIKLVNSEEMGSLSGIQLVELSDKSLWKNIESHTSSFPDWGIAYDGYFFATDMKRFCHKQPKVFLKEILEKEVDPIFDLTEVTKQWVDKNTPVNKFVGGVEILSNQAGGARMGYTIFGINGIAPTLTSSTSRHYERYKVGTIYRRLTPTEYARIQGFPDDHCNSAPFRERYVLYGNAVPPSLVKWVMGRLLLKNEPVCLKHVNMQLPFQYAN